MDVTGHNGHKPKWPQPKRPQTGTATNRNGHKPERPQTETATGRNGYKSKRPQTGTATNRNGHRPEGPQTETATDRKGHKPKRPHQLQDNFMTMRPATIWRRICWAIYRTQYCRIFMKFTGTDGNINTALSATYQMDMPEFFFRRRIQMNYFFNLLGNTTSHFRSLVYNTCISRWWWPTTTILQLWAETADWIISRFKFYIAKHALFRKV